MEGLGFVTKPNLPPQAVNGLVRLLVSRWCLLSVPGAKLGCGSASKPDAHSASWRSRGTCNSMVVVEPVHDLQGVQE